MLPFLRVGPLLIRLPGLALLTGLWVAFSLIERQARGLKLNGEATVRAVSYALIGGLIGARLLFAAEHLNLYLQNPLGLLSLDTTTLNRLGGVVLGLMIALVLGRRWDLPLRPTLDALVPGMAAFMMALGVAHLLSGDAYGTATDVPWAIELWGAMRHPTQVYEILAAALAYLAWRNRPEGRPGSGAGFLRWLTLQTGALMLLEAFRADAALWPGGFRAAQVVGLALVAAALWVATRWQQAEAPQDSRQVP
jgi:prolipoprotein diacylglyceryltransferase